MTYKIFFLLLLSLNSLFAAYEQVRIGKIDRYYINSLSKEQLRTIIDEIEQTFESQLNMNVFDYSSKGKDIDILFIPASKLELRITKKIQKLNIKKEKILALNKQLISNKTNLDKQQDDFSSKSNSLNKKVELYNDYIRSVNKKEKLSKEEYKKVKEYEKKEKEKINYELGKQKKLQNSLRNSLNSYNQKIHLYNNYINEYNNLSNEIESLSRSFKKVKGRTFATQETTLKTFKKDGIEIKEKSVTNSMNKIEIYGFDTLAQLKVVLAHEIAHLVGIPHINVENTLMNPIIQSNQINQLFLTGEDIINFQENY